MHHRNAPPRRISPACSVRGAVQVPGDKSISHRYAMLAAVAEGASTITNYSTGADCQSTLACVESLGIAVNRTEQTVRIEGQGLRGFRKPAAQMDAGNSGSTIRMLSGLLAGQEFTSTIGGDASLSNRPMERIMRPLSSMGASLTAREGKYPPLTIQGAPLQSIDYELPMPSAQVKTCVLFAGLHAEGTTSVTEPVRTRDHTELALREFGAEVTSRRGRVTVAGRPALQGKELTVPGDLSSAAFFLVAALLLPGSELVLTNVGLNPTRAELVEFLVSMGAQIRVPDVQSAGGELVGNLRVIHGPLKGGEISGALTAALIDEIPALAVLGAVTENGLTVRDASELRIKETDRIAAIAENLGHMGIRIEVTPDGFTVPGQQQFHPATLDSYGDHRIAMAFAVAALAAGGESQIINAEAASVSYPEFFTDLESLVEV